MKPILSQNKKPSTFSFIVRSFQYRNYRLYFGGQAFSLMGTTAQHVAIGWLVYSLTNSPFMLGVVDFAAQLPVFLFAPFAGVLVDRWNRHRIFMVTQTLAMLQAFVLCTLFLTGKISVWHIIPLSLFLGLVNAIDLPVRHAFVFNIIEKKEDLGNAISLNTLLFNLGRVLGPPIAGILIAAVGVGIAFLLNGFSYLFIIVALLAMRIKPKKIISKHSDILAGVKEGFVYVNKSAPIKSIILLQGLVSLVAWPATALLPVFVREVLQGGPDTLGFLMGFSGMGALLGTLYLASRKDAFGLVRLIPMASGVLGVALVAFSQSRSTWLAMSLLLFTGFGAFVQLAASGTILQTVVSDDKRGRVMSYYTMAFSSVTFGSLLAGTLANNIGAPKTMMLGGIICVTGSLFFAYKQRLISEAINQTLDTLGSPGKTVQASSKLGG